MAQLPRRRAPDLRALAAALFVGLAPAAASAELDLEGTWHVLVHYRDAKTANADTERWEDRLWVFEAAGDRLRWTEFPIVVFDDESGRFERREEPPQMRRETSGKLRHPGTPQKCDPSVQRGRASPERTKHGGPTWRTSSGCTARTCASSCIEAS